MQELLQEELGQRGLEWIPHLHQFRQIFTGGFFCVILSISGYPDCALAEVHIGIRLDEVEQLTFPHTNSTAGFQPNSMTLVTPLARLFGKRMQRFEIFNQEDAASAAWTVEKQLTQRGLLFLAKLQRVQDMDQLYNKQPELPIPYLHNAIHRCFRGIALAKLVERPGFEALCETYRRVLANRFAPKPTRAKYERLVQFLRNYSQN